MFKAGDLVSAAGKAIGGSALALTGSPTGVGGAILGGAIGSQIGGALGGVTGRTAMAGINRLGDSIGAFKEAKNDMMDKLSHDNLTDELLADKIAESETAKWAKTIKADKGLTNEQQAKKDIVTAFPNATDNRDIYLQSRSKNT